MSNICVSARAKINLFLDVTSKREDGYHNIKSIMQSVDLCDIVHVSYEYSAKKSISVSCSNKNIPTGEKNIAYKAADKMITSGKVSIHIEKNIPSAAGLAGGSADAAAVIFALDSLSKIKRSREELIQIASGIGADVPFCLTGGTSLISGIGDIITPFSHMPPLYLVVACDGEGVSTPKAYAMLDEAYCDFSECRPHGGDIEALKNPNERKSFFNGMYNIFEEVILPIRPAAQALKEQLYSLGAEFSMMSGSGPSIFGIFNSEQNARSACNELRDRGISAHYCTTANTGISTISTV